MNFIKIQSDWFDHLLPEGLPIPSSTLLSGPGGSGKPLVGNVIAASWLRQGGSVVFMSLQYPDPSFLLAGFRSIAQLDLGDYKERVAFIELDVSMEEMTPPIGNQFKANVVKPVIWDAALERACSMVPDEGPGILIFGTALNLLLFSPTYGRKTLEKLKSLVQGASKYSYLFSTSTSAKAEEIAELEAAADNLIMIRSDQVSRKLYLQIEHMKNISFLADEIEVPFSPQALREIKTIADHSRKRIIPQISKL